MKFGITFVFHRLNADALRLPECWQWFGGNSGNWRGAMRGALSERTLAGLHQALEEEISSLPRSGAALDLGCGTGAWLSRLQDLGFEKLWGVDAGPKPCVSGINFIQADLDRDKLEFNRKFDLITLIEVIEHLENPGQTLSMISDLLDEQGFAIVTSPNIHALRARVKFLLTGKLPFFDEMGDPTHITPLFLPGFKKVAIRYGLTVDRCWTFPEKKTVVFGAPIRSAAAMLRMAMPDPFPGDTLCLKLKRVAPVGAS